MQVMYGNESGWFDTVASGEATAYVQTYPDLSYMSGTFHHVRISGLRANTTYYFKCADFSSSLIARGRGQGASLSSM